MARLLVAMLLCASSIGRASAEDLQTVLLVRRGPDDSDAADLERALRPHLTSASATLRVANGTPPASDLDRAAWGAETAARTGASVVLWLEPAGPDDPLTLRMVDARARVDQVTAPAGQRFDQLRTLALVARSHVSRLVALAVATAQAAGSPTERAPRPAPVAERPLSLSPGAMVAPLLGSGGGRIAFGARLEGELRVGRLLAIGLGAEVFPDETLGPSNSPTGGTRTRLPVVLRVSGVIPLEPVELAAGVEGALAIAFLSREASDRVRVAPLLGLRLAGRIRLSSSVFIDVPLSFRVRLAAPGSDATWSPAQLAPGFEAVVGIALGLGR